MATKPRISFKIERSIRHSSDGYAYVRIFHPDSNPTGRILEFGKRKWEVIELAEPWLNIPASFGGFFHHHGSCAYCGKPISSDLAACNCGQAKAAVHLNIRFPHDTIPAYMRLKRNEAYRIAKERRNAILKASGGNHTADEIDGLYLAQLCCCYYCAKRLAGEGGKRRFHKDHYVPVVEGGDNSIENLVLACPECNIEKGRENGSSYEDRHLSKQYIKTCKLLEEIRAGRAAFLASLRRN